MLHKLLLHAVLLLCCTLSHLSAQEDLTAVEKKDPAESYFGSQDLMKADQVHYHERDPIAARVFYNKAILTLEEEKNWEGLIVASTGLSLTYAGREDYEIGISIAKADLRKIENQASTYKKNFFPLLFAINTLYQWAYRPLLALPYAQKSLSILEEYDIENDLAFVDAYNSLGLIHRDIGNIDNALHYFEKAELTLSKSQVADSGRKIATYEHIGFLYSEVNNFDKAIAYTEKGLKLAIETYGENDLSLVMFYHNLAFFYTTLGEYKQGISYYKKEVYIIEKSGTNEERYIAEVLPDCLVSLGMSYLALEESTKARSYFDRSLILLKGKHSETRLKTRAISAIGMSYILEGDTDQALHYFYQANDIYIQSSTLYPEGFYLNGRGADIHLYLGDAFVEKGEFIKGRTHYHKVIQFDLAAGDVDLLKHGASTYWRIANSFEQEGQLDSALYYNHVAITKTYKKTDTLNTHLLPNGEGFRGIPEVYSTLNQRVKLLIALATQQKDKNQQQVFFSQALAVSDLADKAHLENLKKINVLRGAQSNSLIEYSIQNYQDGLAIAHTLYQMTQSSSLLKKGFAYTQKMKAQQLWLSLLKTEAAGFAKVPTSLLESERDLLLNIQYYERKVLEAHENKDTVALNKYENNLLFESRKAYAELVQRMEAEHPEYFEAKYAFKAETEETLQATLKDRELLIEYAFSDSSLYIFTLAKNQPLQITALPLSKQTSEQIETLHKRLQNASWMRRSSREKLITLSHQLYQQFLQPIEEQLNGKDRLIIIGDGMTNYIPFEALLPSAELKPFKHLDYLIKKHAFSYHYSASLFAKSRRSPSLNSNAGVYAFAPVYEKSESLAPLKVAATAPSGNLRAIASDGSFSPLPESEREVKDIIELFEQKNIGTNSLALREKAHEAALKNQLEQAYQFIHIAGHSFADIENPKFSGIACFDEAVDNKEDGILYTGEIYALTAKADLVTLSSCESGFGKLDRTEGLLGLNRAFIYAGSPNVVFSLWKVYDKVSAQLMVDFYGHILAGKDYSNALRLAKLNLLNREATAAPHFWSPYLLIGR